MPLFLDFVLVAGITITAIIIFLLFKQKEKQLPHTVLIVFFGILLFIIVNLYGNIHKLKIVSLLSYIPHHIARWVLGPLLLMYVRSLFIKRTIVIRKSRIHFIPVILFGVFVSVPTLIFESIQKANFEYVIFFKKHSFFITNLSNLYTIIYLVTSYILLTKYSKNITAVYANVTRQNIQWITIVLVGGSILILLNSSIEIYQHIVQVFSTNYSNVFTLLGLIFFVVYLGYYGIHQSSILLPDFLLQQKIDKQVSQFSKKEETKFLQLKKQLETVLETEKPYLDSELTLIKLAKQLNITDKELSVLLNKHMHISFYDIINTYRTKAVQEMIDSKEYENYTLLGIAYECGFNSKASFNRVFKKETGMSPSQYKNR